jgi:sugar phosphate isomerase/epimerase
MKLGVCETVIRTGFESDVAMAAAAGFVGLGIDFGRALDAGLDVARRALDDSGLEASSLIGAGCSADQGTGSEATDKVKRAVEVAVAIGSPFVLVGAGPLAGASIAEADKARTEWVAAMAPLAADAGVRIGFEPFHPVLRAMTYVHTLRHAAAIVGGLPGTGLVVDLSHLWWDPAFLDDVAANVDAILTVQVTGVPNEALAEMRYGRCPPWEGDIPVAATLAAILGTGYDGWFEDEMVVGMPKDERAPYLAASHAFIADALSSADR